MDDIKDDAAPTEAPTEQDEATTAPEPTQAEIIGHLVARIVQALAPLPVDTKFSVACSALVTVVTMNEQGVRALIADADDPDVVRARYASLRTSTTQALQRLALLLPALLAAETDQDFEMALRLFSDDLDRPVGRVN